MSFPFISHLPASSTTLLVGSRRGLKLPKVGLTHHITGIEARATSTEDLSAGSARLIVGRPSPTVTGQKQSIFPKQVEGR